MRGHSVTVQRPTGRKSFLDYQIELSFEIDSGHGSSLSAEKAMPSVLGMSNRLAGPRRADGMH